ncbi:MAG: type I restriction endonuclease [Balneolaceae bacterium]|nr:type I restriction endonuclease [Balneolaceae bacterium]
MILFELKKPARRLYEAYHDNLHDYKDTIPQLFWYNQVIILSNRIGYQSRNHHLTLGAF